MQLHTYMLVIMVDIVCGLLDLYCVSRDTDFVTMLSNMSMLLLLPPLLLIECLALDDKPSREPEDRLLPLPLPALLGGGMYFLDMISVSTSIEDMAHLPQVYKHFTLLNILQVILTILPMENGVAFCSHFCYCEQ